MPSLVLVSAGPARTCLSIRECRCGHDQTGGRGSTRYRVPLCSLLRPGERGAGFAAQGRRPLPDRMDRASGRVKDLGRAVPSRDDPPPPNAAPPTAQGCGSAWAPAALLVNRNDQIRQGYPQRIDDPHDRRPPRVGLPELDPREAAHRELGFPCQAFLGPTALLAKGSNSGRKGMVSSRRGLGHNIVTIADP